MNARDERNSADNFKIPRGLCKEIESQERIIRLLKVGLLVLRAASLVRACSPCICARALRDEMIQKYVMNYRSRQNQQDNKGDTNEIGLE